MDAGEGVETRIRRRHGMETVSVVECVRDGQFRNCLFEMVR